MSSVRWNIVVSPDTDQSVRMYLASQGGGRKGDLSRFMHRLSVTHVRRWFEHDRAVHARNLIHRYRIATR